MARLIQVGCYLRREQLDSLRALSATTLAPMTALMRAAVDQLLAEHSLAPKSTHGAKLSQRNAGMRGTKT